MNFNRLLQRVLEANIAMTRLANEVEELRRATKGVVEAMNISDTAVAELAKEVEELTPTPTPTHTPMPTSQRATEGVVEARSEMADDRTDDIRRGLMILNRVLVRPNGRHYHATLSCQMVQDTAAEEYSTILLRDAEVQYKPCSCVRREVSGKLLTHLDVTRGVKAVGRLINTVGLSEDVAFEVVKAWLRARSPEPLDLDTLGVPWTLTDNVYEVLESMGHWADQ